MAYLLQARASWLMKGSEQMGGMPVLGAHVGDLASLSSSCSELSSSKTWLSKSKKYKDVPVLFFMNS